MKIGFVRVFVTDLEKSREFYTEILGMKIDFTDGERWVQFKSGVDVSLAIEKCDADRVEAGGRLVGRFVGVTMMVEDVSNLHKSLEAKGVSFTAPPEKQPWGGTLAHFKDLDGNVLTLCQEA